MASPRPAAPGVRVPPRWRASHRPVLLVLAFLMSAEVRCGVEALLLGIESCRRATSRNKFTVDIVSPPDGTEIRGPVDIGFEAQLDSGFDVEARVYLGEDPASGLVVLDSDAAQGLEDFVIRYEPRGAMGPRDLRVVLTELPSAETRGMVREDSLTLVYRPPMRSQFSLCLRDCVPPDGTYEGRGAFFFVVTHNTEIPRSELTVTFFVDGVEVGSASGGAELSFEWDSTTVSDGAHDVSARVDWAAGNDSETLAGTLLVNNCDIDHDGFARADEACGGDDCEDALAELRPDAEEPCDGADNDCSGATDDADIAELCPEGQDLCVDGQCLDRCSFADMPCRSDEQSVPGFACVVEEGICRQHCALDALPSGDACPGGAYCRPAADLPFDAGLCYDSECSSAWREPCADGGTCAAVNLNASACMDAGTAQIGDPCIPESTPGPLDQHCANGMRCLGGSCAALCDLLRPAVSCSPGLTCLDLFYWYGGDNTGACTVPCDGTSDPQCEAPLGCSAIVDADGFTGFACLPPPEGRDFLAEGEPCDPLRDLCEEGTICDGGSPRHLQGHRCTRLCAFFPPEGTQAPLDRCDAGLECVPVSRDFLGTCRAICDPWAPDGGDACQPDETCFPWIDWADRTDPVLGACIHDGGTGAPWEACAQPAFVGECADGAVCLDTSADAERNPICHPICDPWTTDSGCADGEVCNPRAIAEGLGPVGGCDREWLDLGEGDACDELGVACREDGTLCIDLGRGPRCYRSCRQNSTCATGTCSYARNTPGLPSRVNSFYCIE